MQATTYDKFIFAMLGYIPCISCKLFSNECKLIEIEAGGISVPVVCFFI